MRKVILGTLVAVLAGGGSTLASADPASHRRAVERLFELTQMQEKVDEGVGQVLVLQLRQSPALAEHQELVRAFLEKQIGWNALREPLIGMYVAAFSEQELAEMNAFYASPTGQKVIVRLPQLVQERNQLAMRRLQAHIDELEAAVAEATGKK